MCLCNKELVHFIHGVYVCGMKAVEGGRTKKSVYERFWGILGEGLHTTAHVSYTDNRQFSGVIRSWFTSKSKGEGRERMCV